MPAWRGKLQGMKTKINKIPFIIIDGQDGSGKGTQIRLLKERIEKEHRTAVFTREPGGVPLSEALRTVIKSDEGMSSDALTQFLMFWAARNEWVKQLVVPNLTKGIPIFSDRGDSSTFAYQVIAKNTPELEEEFWRVREMVFGDYEPTLYIIIDVPAEVARERSLSDGEHTSAFDTEHVDFYERVRQGFRDFSKKAHTNVFFIDGTRTPEIIHKEIYSIVSELCGWK